MITDSHHAEPTKWLVVLAERSDIAPDELFVVNDMQYRAITGSIGYHVEPLPGIRIPAGMVNDPLNPLPDNAITAVRIGPQ